MNPNVDIEKRIVEAGLLKWQVASSAGIADTTLSRWLRTKLTGDRRERIEKAIDELVKVKE